MKRGGSKGSKPARKSRTASGNKLTAEAVRERRRHPRRSASAARASGAAPESSKKSTARTVPAAKATAESCANCDNRLKVNDRALFVEEELGRVFCSEACIADFFTADIERLEKEYFRYADHEDFSPEERESLAHLRWITLEEPDEIWREKTIAGDFRYSLISEFKPGEHPGDQKVWYVCICLFLRGEPSFLFMAFPTRSAALLERYRRGERLRKIAKVPHDPKQGPRVGAGRPGRGGEAGSLGDDSNEVPKKGTDEEPRTTDRLAADWTIEESFLAGLAQERTPEDIQPSEFVNYQWCLEDTLEEPDELWSLVPHVQGGVAHNAAGAQLYHFIKKFEPKPEAGQQSQPPFWFLVVARETENEEEIEILDAAPTRDQHLVGRYRQGEQEAVEDAPERSAHTVH